MAPSRTNDTVSSKYMPYTRKAQEWNSIVRSGGNISKHNKIDEHITMRKDKQRHHNAEHGKDCNAETQAMVSQCEKTDGDLSKKKKGED